MSSQGVEYTFVIQQEEVETSRVTTPAREFHSTVTDSPVVVMSSEGAQGIPGPDGSIGPDGPTGLDGARGPQGPPGDVTYADGSSAPTIESILASPQFSRTFNFSVPSTTWTMNHNLGRKQVDIVTVDVSGVEIIGDVFYMDNDNLYVEWYYETAGTAVVSL